MNIEAADTAIRDADVQTWRPKPQRLHARSLPCRRRAASWKCRKKIRGLAGYYGVIFRAAVCQANNRMIPLVISYQWDHELLQDCIALSKNAIYSGNVSICPVLPTL